MRRRDVLATVGGALATATRFLAAQSPQAKRFRVVEAGSCKAVTSRTKAFRAER
jgi:hypothetical protein